MASRSYDPVVKKAFLAAAAKARARGLSWSEAHILARAAGYRGNVRALARLLHWSRNRKPVQAAQACPDNKAVLLNAISVSRDEHKGNGLQIIQSSLPTARRWQRGRRQVKLCVIASAGSRFAPQSMPKNRPINAIVNKIIKERVQAAIKRAIRELKQRD